MNSIPHEPMQRSDELYQSLSNQSYYLLNQLESIGRLQEHLKQDRYLSYLFHRLHVLL